MKLLFLILPVFGWFDAKVTIGPVPECPPVAEGGPLDRWPEKYFNIIFYE